MTEAATLIEQVEDARSTMLASVRDLTDIQCSYQPDDTQWSIVQVVEHLYLAEISGVAKIWAALTLYRAGESWTGTLPNRGMSIEAVIAHTWKAKEVAPPIATPHIGGPMSFWRTATHSLKPVLADLGAELKDTSLDEVVYPHFLCGPLDGRQRLEFLRFHIARHDEQILRIRGSAHFPQ